MRIGITALQIIFLLSTVLLAFQLCQKGIGVTVICPGPIQTENSSGGSEVSSPTPFFYSFIYCIITLFLWHISSAVQHHLLNFYLHLILLSEACAIREMLWTDNCCCDPWSKRSLDIVPGFSVFHCNIFYFKILALLQTIYLEEAHSWYYPIKYCLLLSH